MLLSDTTGQLGVLWMLLPITAATSRAGNKQQASLASSWLETPARISFGTFDLKTTPCEACGSGA